jgi:adenylate kinase family enzyme
MCDFFGLSLNGHINTFESGFWDRFGPFHSTARSIMNFVILTGASGAGKTAIANVIAATLGHSVTCLHFDSIGVPSTAQMIEEYGSGEGWQKAITFEWVKRIETDYLVSNARVLFEGQMRISFILEAIKRTQIQDYRIVLVDCNDGERRRRLVGSRSQPDLANPTMVNWARYLREEARELNSQILDTSDLDLATSAKAVRELLDR